MDNIIKTILENDPLANAEKILGKNASQDSITSLGFAMQMQKSKIVEKIMEETDDTHFGVSFDKAAQIIVSEGFRLVHHENFGDMDNERYRIYFSDKEGILLTLESYNGKSCNMIQMYFNWRSTDQKRVFPDGCSCHVVGKDNGYTSIAHKDVREGFRYSLRELRSNGTFVTPWIERPFLWLLNYEEKNQPGYDYNKINDGKIAQLPQEVQLAIKGE